MSGISLASFGSLEPSAQYLIDRARALVPPGQALDIMQVMLAALSEESSQHAPDLTALVALSTGGVNPDTLRTVLTVELRVQAHPATDSDNLTAEMRRCIQRWRAKAAERNLRVTVALILWAILSDDNSVTARVAVLGGDRAAMVEEMESHFQPVLPTSSMDARKMPPRVVPVSLAPADAAAYAKAASLTHIMQPTPTLQHRGMHALLMANLLNVLGSSESPEIVILEGRNGTPLRSASMVLAERLVGGEAFTGQRIRLGQYRAVHRLDLESVRRLDDIPEEPSPQDVLQMAMQQAVEDQAILVLDNMETLASKETTEESLLAQLANPGDALVIGLYERAERGEVGVESALRLQNARLVVAHEYSVEQTRALLFEHYVPMWQSLGFTVEPNTFDSVIALEPGAWINLKRKTLPYLVVGLGLDTMETINEGRALILDTARAALDRLNALRQEWATTDERMRDQYAEVLAQARTDIESLIADPQVRTDKGKRVITRAHLVAQLICPNDSEFHYPGHAPKEVQRQDPDDDVPYR